MFWIIGGDALFQAVGRWLGWPVLVTQMDHVKWEGFRFYDLIFPLFLFIVGVVLPFSLARYAEGASDRRAAYRRIGRRALLLVVLGFIYWGNLNKPWPEIRWMGVLQRIGICYFAAAVAVTHLRVKGLAVLAAVLLVGYWVLMTQVAAPGFSPGDLTMEGNLAGYVDRLLIPGKFCCYPFGDNEGLLSTIPAIGTTLLGVLTGFWLRCGRPGREIAGGLAVAGAGSLAVGLLWGHWFPIIKILWTSSYVLVAAGFSVGLLALFYYAIDVRGWRRGVFALEVIGVNAITIYLLHDLVDFGRITNYFVGNLARHAGGAGPVVVALTVLVIEWLLLRYLYLKGTRLRV